MVVIATATAIAIGGIALSGVVAALFGYQIYQSEQMSKEQKKQYEENVKANKEATKKNEMYTIIGLLIGLAGILLTLYVFTRK